MTKVKMVIASHLYDAKLDTDQNLLLRRLSFIQWLLFKYPNTNDQISDEELNEIWSYGTHGK